MRAEWTRAVSDLLTLRKAQRKAGPDPQLAHQAGEAEARLRRLTRELSALTHEEEEAG